MENEYENEPLSLEDKLALARSKLWTPELDKLLRRWKRQIDSRRKGHIKISQQYDKKHYLLGVPATVLTTITTTGTLTTFQDCSSTSNTTSTSFWCTSAEWIRLAIGIIGIIAVVLTGILTFMNFQKAAQDHKKAADEYESLVGTIDSILSIPRVLRGDPVDRLKLIRDQYDAVLKEAPTLAEKYKTELGFEVVGTKRPNEVINMSNTIVDPNNVKIDDRDDEMIKKDKSVLKEIMKDMLNKKDSSPEKIEEVKTPSPLKVTINEKDREFYSEENFSSGEEIEKRNNEIEQRNNFDSEDESQEVCIGFDIDKMAQMGQNTTLIAMASLQAQRDRQIQESLNQALKFEMSRMSDAQRKSPRMQNSRVNRSRENYYYEDYTDPYLGGSPTKTEYNDIRRSSPNRVSNNVHPFRRRMNSEISSNTSPSKNVDSPQRKSQQSQILNNSDIYLRQPPTVEKVVAEETQDNIATIIPPDVKNEDKNTKENQNDDKKE